MSDTSLNGINVVNSKVKTGIVYISCREYYQHDYLDFYPFTLCDNFKAKFAFFHRVASSFHKPQSWLIYNNPITAQAIHRIISMQKSWAKLKK